MAEVTMKELLATESKRDPESFFRRLREQEPLSKITLFSGMKGWLVTGYDDAIAILKDPRYTKDRQKIIAWEAEQGIEGRSESQYTPFAWRRDLLMVDPPDHTRLRSLVSKVFTPRMIENLRPRIQQITDELLDAVQGQGQMDLIADFAFPLPITVISEMLGIPVADRQQFRDWTQMLVNSAADPEREKLVRQAEEAFYNYIESLLEEKRAHPGNDLTSDLVRAEDNGDKLNERELISMIWILIIAGHETTVNLIGSGTLALLENPEQLRLLQQDASLLPSAVEELLRYTAPVIMSTPRWANEDVELHGQTIHKGEAVFAGLISANNDPLQFPDPALLDITRQENKHVAFGKGIHVCLGAPLARLEGQIAFGTLLRRMPQLRLAVEPDQLNWNRNPILRGVTSLPVTF